MTRTGLLLVLALAAPVLAETPAHARLAADFLEAHRARNKAKLAILAAKPARDVEYALAVRALHRRGEAAAARALAEGREAAGGPEGKGLLRLIIALEAGQGPSPAQIAAWEEAEKLIAGGSPAQALRRLGDAGTPIEGTVHGANVAWTKARALHFDSRPLDAARAFGETARLALAVGWPARARAAQRARLATAKAQPAEALAAADGLVEVARLLEDGATLVFALDQRAGLRIEQGLGEEGRGDFLEAAEVARRLGRKVVAAQILGKLALVLQVREGQPRTSLRFHKQSLELAREAKAGPFLRIALFNNAVVYTTLAEYGRALALLDELLALEPAMLDAHVQRAYVLRRQGRWEKGRAAFERSLDLVRDPDRRDDLRLKLGELQLERGDLESAEALFGQVLGRNPREWRALLGRAITHGVRGAEESAAADFDAALEFAERPAWKGRVLYRRAVVEGARGRTLAARRHAAKALDHLIEACESEDKADHDYPTAAAAYALVGDLLLMDRRHEEALELIGRGAVFFRNMRLPQQSIPQYARWLLVLVGLDRTEDAIERLQVMNKMAQGTSDAGLKCVALCAEAILEARAGRVDGALRLLREALALARQGADPVREATALAHLALLGKKDAPALARRAIEIMRARRVYGVRPQPLVEGEHPGFAPGIGVHALLGDEALEEAERARQGLFFIETARSLRLQLALGGRTAVMHEGLTGEEIRAYAGVRGRLVEARAEGTGVDAAESAFDAATEPIANKVPFAFPRPPALEALQEALRPDEALLLMLDDPYARAMVGVTRERAVLRAFESERPLEAVADLLEGKRKLLVAPDGVLAVEATPWKEGAALDAFGIFYVNGAEAFLRLRARPFEAGDGVAAVGSGPARLGPPLEEPPAERVLLLHVGRTVALDLTHPPASGRGLDPRWNADLLVLAAAQVDRGAHPSSDGVGVVAARCHAAGSSRVLLSLGGPPPPGLLDRFYANWLDEKMSPAFALREARLWWRGNAAEKERPHWAALVLYGLP